MVSYRLANADAPTRLSLRAERLRGPRRADVAVLRRRRHCRAVHEPGADVAGAVDPENIAHAVAVVVAGLSNIPGGRYVAEHRGRQDLSAVHQPDADIAAGIAPENVGRPIAVEVTNAGNLPGRRHRPEVYRLDDIGAVHHPHSDLVGRGVVPEDVALAVRSGNSPRRWHVADDRRLHDRRAVHEPDAEVAAGVTPQNVAVAVAVEVTGADHTPRGRNIAEHAGGQNLGAVHQPDADIAAVVTIKHIGIAVAVEVALADGGPGRHIAEHRVLRDRRAVHQPHADVVRRIAPENVALAVTVEVMSGHLDGIDTGVVRGAGEIRRVLRHRHAVDERDRAGKARLLRIRAQRPATGGRGINKRTGNVVAHHLVGRGVEVRTRCGNPRRCSALFDPLDQRRQEVKSVGRRAPRAVVHIRNTIEPREVLGAVHAAELFRHSFVVVEIIENGRARIAPAMIPDDLVPIVDEVLDVERCRGRNDRRNRVQYRTWRPCRNFVTKVERERRIRRDRAETGTKSRKCRLCCRQSFLAPTFRCWSRSLVRGCRSSPSSRRHTYSLARS